jgi:hypothetical protein
MNVLVMILNFVELKIGVSVPLDGRNDVKDDDIVSANNHRTSTEYQRPPDGTSYAAGQQRLAGIKDVG